MKITFSSEGKGIESTLASHFGRCPYFVFVTIENDEVKSIETKENPFFNKHEPGAVPGFIAEEKADAIISGGMGPRAIEWFNEAKIKPITTEPRKIKDILDDYLEGKLTDAEACDQHR